MSHIGYMDKKTPPNRIAEFRKWRGLTQQQLGDLVGSHWITISKLERGQMRLTQDWLEKLGAALQVPEKSLLPGRLNEQGISVAGSIRGGQVGLYESAIGKTITFPPDDDGDVWIEVGDDGLKPFFLGGDYLRFRAIANDSASYALGRVVLVSNENGLALLGTLEAEHYPHVEQPDPRLHREVEISVTIRTFTGMVHRDLTVTDIFVFDGCHVFWPRHS